MRFFILSLSLSHSFFFFLSPFFSRFFPSRDFCQFLPIYFFHSFFIHRAPCSTRSSGGQPSDNNNFCNFPQSSPFSTGMTTQASNGRNAKRNVSFRGCDQNQTNHCNLILKDGIAHLYDIFILIINIFL